MTQDLRGSADGGGVIELHRIRGESFHLNADLIETIEHRGDTVLTLSDGRHLVVQETPDQVVDAVRLYRASIHATARRLDRGASPNLVALPGGRADDD